MAQITKELRRVHSYITDCGDRPACELRRTISLRAAPFSQRANACFGKGGGGPAILLCDIRTSSSAAHYGVEMPEITTGCGSRRLSAATSRCLTSSITG